MEIATPGWDHSQGLIDKESILRGVTNRYHYLGVPESLEGLSVNSYYFPLSIEEFKISDAAMITLMLQYHLLETMKNLSSFVPIKSIPSEQIKFIADNESILDAFFRDPISPLLYGDEQEYMGFHYDTEEIRGILVANHKGIEITKLKIMVVDLTEIKKDSGELVSPEVQRNLANMYYKHLLGLYQEILKTLMLNNILGGNRQVLFIAS